MDDIFVHKDFESTLPTSTTGEVTVTYWIKNVPFGSGIVSEDLARAALVANADTVYDGRLPTNASVTRIGPTTWRGEVTYTSQDWDYQFEVTTQQAVVTRSLETRGQFKRGSGTATNFNRLIGVTRDGVEGTQIEVPVFAWSETHTFDSAFVNDDYRDALYQTVGKINNGNFRRYEPGEVLFAGVTGGIARGQTRYTLNFRFLASPNLADLNVDGITVSNKKGWDYLWAYVLEFPDTTTGRLVRRIDQINVEAVYESADFNRLQLPA